VALVTVVTVGPGELIGQAAEAVARGAPAVVTGRVGGALVGPVSIESPSASGEVALDLGENR
jgi:hypothetical protein